MRVRIRARKKFQFPRVKRNEDRIRRGFRCSEDSGRSLQVSGGSRALLSAASRLSEHDQAGRKEFQREFASGNFTHPRKNRGGKEAGGGKKKQEAKQHKE